MDLNWRAGQWVAVLAALVALAVTVYLRKLYARWHHYKALGVATVSPLEQIRNTMRIFAGQATLVELNDRLYKRFTGHKVCVTSLSDSGVMVRDPELVHQILVKDFSSFHDKGFVMDVETNPLEGHLFAMAGDKWRTLRNKLSPTFTSGKLKGMYSLMTSCGEALLKSVEKRIREATEAEGSADLEVTDILACFTTDVIGSCAFGYEPSAIEDPDCDFRRMGRRIFRPTAMETTIGILRFFFPAIMMPLKIRTVPKEVNDFFFDVTRKTLEHRAKTGEKRNDFLQLLLQLKQKGSVEIDHRDVEDNEDEPAVDDGGPEAHIEFTDEILTAQVFGFFAAGFETSASAMSFALYCLSKNQGVQDKARQEVREMKRKHGAISYAALKDMPYLEACLNETLRMYSPIGMLMRECTKSCRLNDGTLIEKGAKILIPTVSIQKDPEYFPEPKVFDPERFCPGKSVLPGTYLPFGDGPRICIGKRFAVVEAKMGLAMILDGYVVRPSPKQKEPMKLNPRTFISQPVDGIWLNFSRPS